jgi:hypothetical protein
MTIEEANAKLSETTAFIFQEANGQYGWMTIMSESDSFDTVKEAYDDVVSYLKQGGY